MKLTIEKLEEKLQNGAYVNVVTDNSETFEITASRFTAINNEKIDTFFILKNSKKIMISKEEFIRIHNKLV